MKRKKFLFDVLINDGNNECKFETVKLNKRITKSFRGQFGASFDYFIIDIKKYIKSVKDITININLFRRNMEKNTHFNQLKSIKII